MQKNRTCGSNASTELPDVKTAYHDDAISDNPDTSWLQPIILRSIEHRNPESVNSGSGPDCDCACPDSEVIYLNPTFDGNSVLKVAASVHTQTLPKDHTLIFNPLHNGGIAVLNKAAEQVRQSFVAPRRLQDLDGNLAQIVSSLVDVGALEYEGIEPTLKRGKARLLSAWIHVTNECNLRCDYCYIRKTNDHMDEATGRATVDAIFRSAEKYKFERVKLKFAGGEATMNLKRVLDIHKYSLEKAGTTGIAVDSVVLSNGVVITDHAIEQFVHRGIRISISLDGIGLSHDKQRKFSNGTGSFKWVNQNIDKLMLYGIKPFVSITLSARNTDGLPDTVRYCVERDLPFNINFFRDNECSSIYSDLQIQDTQIIKAMHEAFSILEHNMPSRSLLGALIDRSNFDQPHDKTCSVGDSYLVVDHKGNVAKCQMEIERSVGNIFAEDPLALIRDDRHGIKNLSVNEKEGCRDCEWRNWCAGGCPALTFRATGRWDVKSPNCNIYKSVYPGLLRLEGLRLLKLHGLN